MVLNCSTCNLHLVVSDSLCLSGWYRRVSRLKQRKTIDGFFSTLYSNTVLRLFAQNIFHDQQS